MSPVLERNGSNMYEGCDFRRRLKGEERMCELVTLHEITI